MCFEIIWLPTTKVQAPFKRVLKRIPAGLPVYGVSKKGYTPGQLCLLQGNQIGRFPRGNHHSVALPETRHYKGE